MADHAFRGMEVWAEAPAHREALLAAVGQARLATPGSSLAMASPESWSSPKTLFEDARTQPLQLWLAAAVQAHANPGEEILDLSGWANILLPGQQIGRHAHERSHLGGLNAYAGVYYVQAEGGAGILALYPSDLNVIEIVPTEGRVVLFTADTPHEVRPHWSPAPRISIAFNVRLRSESACARSVGEPSAGGDR